MYLCICICMYVSLQELLYLFYLYISMMMSLGFCNYYSIAISNEKIYLENIIKRYNNCKILVLSTLRIKELYIVFIFWFFFSHLYGSKWKFRNWICTKQILGNFINLNSNIRSENIIQVHTSFIKKKETKGEIFAIGNNQLIKKRLWQNSQVRTYIKWIRTLKGGGIPSHLLPEASFNNNTYAWGKKCGFLIIICFPLLLFRCQRSFLIYRHFFQFRIMLDSLLKVR